MKRILLSALFILMMPFLFGEEKTGVELSYFDDYNEIEILDIHGNIVEDISFGDILPMGFAVKTYDSTAELKLVPNGTIIKIGADTLFKIERLQNVQQIETTTFALVSGKIRCVAARYSNSNYLIRTPSAVMGVRGTDFIAEVNEDNESQLYVEEGKVEFYDTRRGESRMTVAGQSISTIGERFAAEAAGIVEKWAIKAEMMFDRLDIESVPRRIDDAIENTFRYFENFDEEKHRKFFEDDNFFDDADEYLEQFSEYYSTYFNDLLERIDQAIDEEAIEERVEEKLNEAENKVKDLMDNLFNRNRDDE